MAQIKEVIIWQKEENAGIVSIAESPMVTWSGNVTEPTGEQEGIVLAVTFYLIKHQMHTLVGNATTSELISQVVSLRRTTTARRNRKLLTRTH